MEFADLLTEFELEKFFNSLNLYNVKISNIEKIFNKCTAQIEFFAFYSDKKQLATITFSDFDLFFPDYWCTVSYSNQEINTKWKKFMAKLFGEKYIQSANKQISEDIYTLNTNHAQMLAKEQKAHNSKIESLKNTIKLLSQEVLDEEEIYKQKTERINNEYSAKINELNNQRLSYSYLDLEK